MYRFFENINIDNIDKGIIQLSEDNCIHAKNVLRLSENDKIIICDGNGYDYLCCISEITKHSVCANIEKKSFNNNEPNYELTVFQALPKSDKMEFIIQKCTELGVSYFVPFTSERTVVKLDSKTEEARRKRWLKISESASKQSQRGIIPKISEILTLEDAIKYAKKLDSCAVAYERTTCKSVFMQNWIYSFAGKTAGIFIGPEGGFSDNEVNLFSEYDITQVSMGRRILRTETAPLVFASGFLLIKDSV